MGRGIRYNAVFIKPNNEDIIMENCNGKELRQYLEILLKVHYNIDYPFKTYTYVLYDLRCRRNRINKIIKDIIPVVEIVTTPLNS